MSPLTVHHESSELSPPVTGPVAPSPLPSGASGPRRSLWLYGGGTLVLGLSFAVVSLAFNTHGAGAGTAGAESTSLRRRAVAVAYFDVDGGVAPMQPLKTGLVVAVPAVEGQMVSEGTVLIQMDDTLEKQQLIEAEQDRAASREKLAQANNLIVQHQKKVAAAKAGLRVARFDVDMARDQQEKAKRLYNSDVGGSKEDVAMAGHAVQKAEAALQARQAEVAVLESIDSQVAVRLANIDVAAKEAQVRKARYNLDLCQLKTKTRGRVLRLQVTVGETLGPNPQRPAILFCPDKPPIVRAEVEQEFARFVKVGQTATIQDDATGGGNWTGKVRSLSQWYTHRRSILLEPLQFNDVRTLECILDLEASTANTLRIGQRVLVTLEGGS